MSAMQDLKKTWVDKFGGELPASSMWVEDVKTNLQKHKSRVETLKKSLKEEEEYVVFLEALLLEIIGHGNNSDGGKKDVQGKAGESIYTGSDNISDAIKDTLQRRSQGEANKAEAVAAEKPQASEQGSGGSNKVEWKARQSSFSKPPSEPSVGNGKVSQPGASSSSPNAQLTEEQFVTVIEVNGHDKEKRNHQANGNKEKESDNHKERKPVPPIPPPKNVKRGSSDLPTPPAARMPFSSFGYGPEIATNKPHEVIESQLRFVEDKNCLEWLGERNVVFDSRSKQSSRRPTEGSTSSSNSSSLSSSAKDPLTQSSEAVEKKENTSTKPIPKKKFEGSKFPLPPKDERLQQRRKASSSNSANSGAQSSSSPGSERKNAPRSKISDMIGKLEGNQRRSDQGTPNRSFREASQSVDTDKKTKSETELADYMDPRDAESILNEEIYDLPPDSPVRSNSLEKRRTHESGVPVDAEVLECEPVYDTVAPDQENDDDYVVLLEDEGGKTGGSSSSSGRRKDSSQSAEVKLDSATIRSQTSMVSGHSVMTTSSGGTASDTEGILESPVPGDITKRDRTPSTNYVNLEYFLCKSKTGESYVSESEPDSDVESGLHHDGFHRGDCKSSQDDLRGSSNGNTFPGKPSEEAPTMRVADQVKLKSYQARIGTIAASENQYVEVLNLLLQYMKAMKGTFSTSKPVLSTDDFNVIFYKIPELHGIHHKFLMGLQEESTSGRWEVGKHFESLAKEVDVYGSFLQNYSRAVDTVKKCSLSNAAFADTTRDIRSRTLNINAGVTLETLLHSPVSRVQKNLEIVKDMLKSLPEAHPDAQSLENAQKLFQLFLSDFQMIQPEQLSEKNVRKLVKNSFIVELSETTRKLRHLFLFNDVLVCAKYKPSGKKEKFTYELKWHIPISDILVAENSEPRETAPINLVALRSRASNVRDQIKRQSSRDDKKQKAEKNRKKLAELESQLVLASPNLMLKLKTSTGKSTGTFFLSSEYDRSQWIETIETLKKQSALLPAFAQLSSNDLQQWITKNRRDLKTNMYMGSYLMRTGSDEHLLVGDFYIMIGQLSGIKRPADLYICLEVDSYGHFFRKAKTKMICGSSQPSWNEDFIIELEGSLNLRVLLYEEHPTQGQLIRAATSVELNRSWIQGSMVRAIEKTISMQDYTLSVSTRFTPSEMTIRRVPTSKAGALFGAKITQVCKREKRQVPFIITSCVKEVERRGINEQGIYRVSGSASDGVRLKKAFETNCYEAEQLLKEVDINSVASLLKTYLRELPEALFTDDLYPRFFEAFSMPDEEMKAQSLIQTFDSLPPLNQHIIMFLLDHMTRINEHEKHNKMSINNLATVFGPTLLRPGGKSSGNISMDMLAAGTANCIAQTGILYFFLWRRAHQEPFQLGVIGVQ